MDYAKMADWLMRLWPKRPGPSVFGVGAAKTGTNSLATLFAGAGIKAAHEPDCEVLIDLILARKSGRLDARAFRASVRKVIDQSALEANVSQINGYMIEDLCPLYPRSKFILTVRDAESWVQSFFNHATTRPMKADDIWHRFRALRFNRELPYGPEDENLRQNGFQSLDSYLTYWVEHTLSVLTVVPERQLFILPTGQIGTDTEALAKFVNTTKHLAAKDAHANRGSYSGKLLVAPAYLRQRCAFFTAQLLERARGKISATSLQALEKAVSPGAPDYYAQAEGQRISQAQDLKANRATDVERWKNVAAESDDRWDGRARLAATMVADQPSVVDLGCGAMLIERHLAPHVRYIPVDVVQRDARTIVCDLNASSGRLPAGLEATSAVALGLFEYMHDVPAILQSIAREFEWLVCSYIPTETTSSIDQRRATGWMSDYSLEEMESAFAAAGFSIVQREVYLGKTHLWRLRSSRSAPAGAS